MAGKTRSTAQAVTTDAVAAGWDGRKCIGCGGAAYAGRHLIDVDRVTVIAWHPDCHATATGCEICAAVVAAHPDLKDHALGQAVFEANPNAPVSYGGAHFGQPLTTEPPAEEE